MQRRTVLSGLASSIPPVLAGPRPARAAEPAEVAHFEQRLASFAAGLRYDDLPAAVVAAVRAVLLDTIGCALGAVGTEAAAIAERTVRGTYGTGEAATVIGYPRGATVEGAAVVNGVLVRSLDLNDTYLGTEPLHPSEALPAALAICEERGSGGRDLVAAIVAGYEASARVTDAISFIERGFHPLCALAYATPVMAGKLWDLPAPVVAHALGLSGARGYTSFVVNSGAISMMKAMGFALSAADGIFVTRLAAAGFTGPSGTLEYFAAQVRPGRAEVALDLELGGPGRYRLPRVAFKRYPIQIELAAVAEAGSLIGARLGARRSGIAGIVVETYPGIIERVADAPKFRPGTRGTADHSLPVCLALALLDGDVTTHQFDTDRWRDRDVMALVGRTTVQPGAALMARRPKGRGATVTVRLEDGETMQETVEVPEGDAERPLSPASLERKFMGLAVPVLGEGGARKVVAAAAGIEGYRDIRAFTALLRGPGRQG